MQVSVPQVFFIILSFTAFFLAYRGFARIWRNIQLGQPEVIGGDSAQRWRNVLLVAFGQKKMFKLKISAFLHLAIYVAFLVTQIELLEIFLDGLTGAHRAVWHVLEGTWLAWLYPLLISSIEVLSVLAFVATLAFLVRRNALHLPRFRKPEMKGWPKADANNILFFEILLIAFIMMMNAGDLAMQARGMAHPTPPFAISQFIAPALAGLSDGMLSLIERTGWWGHLMMVFLFLNYLPYSKHLHILLAFPNTYFAKLTPRGEMENMPAVMNEVKSMMGLAEASDNGSEELPEFGAKDLRDLSWKNLLDAYSCTECGRCTAACPANLTGKKLSPRKVMMDIRDRAEEIGKKLDSGDPQWIREDLRASETALSAANFDDGKTLFDYISREEIHACTTCNACVEACPVLINPLDPILKLRRYEILSESAGPADWLPMFNSMENSGAVWQVSTDREDWLRQMAD